MADPYVIFPGTAGNFVSSDDVNLLDADTAHLEQSTGTYQTGYLFATPTLVADSLSRFGDNVAQALTDDSQTFGYIGGLQGTSAIPISGSTEYSFAIGVRAGVAGRQGRIALVYWDAGGAYVAEEVNPAWSDLDTAQFIDLGASTLASPATAAFVTLRVQYQVDGVASFDVGEAVRIDRSSLRAGSDASFVPSLRIVGVLDERIDTAVDDWASATSYLWDGHTSDKGTGLLLSGGILYMYYGDGLGGAAQSVAYTPSFDAGSQHTIRVTRDAGTGTVEWIIDGVNEETDSTTPGAVVYGGDVNRLVIGAALAGTLGLPGKVWSYERRDGIGGPVVARFDAGDVPQPAQLPI